MSRRKTAIIIGAGPAGLTAAHELLKHTDVKPVVFEASNDIGGISKTVKYKGNRIDIGGHRFFSKSDVVMKWWQDILPIENTPKSSQFTLKYQGKSLQLKGGKGADPNKTDDVMLVRSRLSRIYYDGKFFNYPITLEADTMKNLGLKRLVKIGFSYIAVRVKPRPENNLEDFYINRFGKELYNTFFKDYTEKVWGVPCNEIAADWGAQRIKGLSISKAITHAFKKQLPQRSSSDVGQKNTETSLIEYFLYPKLGPGHMWETVAKRVRQQGGVVRKNHIITAIHAKQDKIVAVEVFNTKTNKAERVTGDYFFSTMPVKELIAAFKGVEPSARVRKVADGLLYRDFITVGLLVKRLRTNSQSSKSRTVPDNWIYIQEPDVKVGRLQIFNNWSPYLVKNKNQVWVGMEYFATEGDTLWNKSDKAMTKLGVEELVKIGMITESDVIDTTVIKVKKTYPAYFGTYKDFPVIRKFTDSFSNLFLLGRNGQHRYNNQDHSMLTAIEAVKNIKEGRLDKANIWNINSEKEYHETK